MINLSLSIEQIDLILATLSKAPYEVSAELIQEIRNQAIPQLSKTEPDSE